MEDNSKMAYGGAWLVREMSLLSVSAREVFSSFDSYI